MINGKENLVLEKISDRDNSLENMIKNIKKMVNNVLEIHNKSEFDFKNTI